MLSRLRLDGWLPGRIEDVDTEDDDVRGAIAGSYPIWGRYAPLTFPNWATKFFIDALIAARSYA